MPKVDYKKERDAAAALWPECKDEIYGCCFDEICPAIAEHYDFDSIVSAIRAQEVDVAEWAHGFAHYVGDEYRVLIDLVTTSEAAFLWARDIGDRDEMRLRISEDTWAIKWALHFGEDEHEAMARKISTPVGALKWACEVGTYLDIVRDKLDGHRAIAWAKKFGEHDLVHQFVTSSEDAYNWAREFPGRAAEVVQLIQGERWKTLWVQNVGLPLA